MPGASLMMRFFGSPPRESRSASGPGTEADYQQGGGERSRCPSSDYSLHTAKSRPAKVGDRLVTRNFNTGTRGFAAPEDARTAVCVLPGTELAFDKELQCARIGLLGQSENNRAHYSHLSTS